MQRKQVAIGGVFAAVGAVVVGLGVAFGGTAPAPEQPVTEVGQVQVSTTTSPAVPLQVEAQAPAAPVAPAAVTTTVPVPQKPAAKGQNGPVTNNEPTTVPQPGEPYDSDGKPLTPNPPLQPGETAPLPPREPAPIPAPPTEHPRLPSETTEAPAP